MAEGAEVRKDPPPANMGGGQSVEDMLADIAGNREELERQAVEEEEPAPERAPEPEREPPAPVAAEAEEDDDDDEAPESRRRERDPLEDLPDELREGFDELPEQAREVILRQQDEIQRARSNIRRRKQQLSDARREYEERTASILGRLQQAPAEAPGKYEQPEPAPQSPGPRLRQDPETGEYYVPPEELNAAIQQAQQPMQEAQRQQQAKAQRIAELTQSIPEDTAARLRTAYLDAIERAQEEVKLSGQPPRNRSEQRRMIEESGIARDVEKEYGIPFDDLWDLDLGVSDPFNFDHLLARVAQKYSAPPPARETPSPAPREPKEAPRPMSKRGRRAGNASKAVDEFVQLSARELDSMSAEEFAEWKRRLSDEFGARF